MDRPLTVAKQHCVNDKTQQNQPEGQREETEYPYAALLGIREGFHEVILKLTGLDHLFILAGLVEFELFHGDPPTKYNGIHGELVGPEVGIEEVDRKYESNREQRLIAMDNRRHIEGPARNDVCERFREPQNQSCAADYGHTPGYREVVELLPIRVTAVIGAIAQSEEVTVALKEILDA